MYRIVEGGTMKTNKHITKLAVILMAIMLVASFATCVVATTESTAQKQEETMNEASEKLLSNVNSKDKRIAELTDKYNDQLYGRVAYYLEIAQKYSIPICLA